MTRFKAETLGQIYETLEAMEHPIAVFDFFSGEMGYEALCAQAICGKFYDDFHPTMPVVALTWKGCSVFYENVSDHQVELQDVELSMLGNLRHRGEPRWATLVLAEHRERIAGTASVAECKGPTYWASGHVLDVRLAGFIRPGYLEKPTRANREGIITAAAERLIHSRYVFRPGLDRLITEPYIALFDRNETYSPWRNTQEWHIEWFDQLASKHGIKLVVMAGLHPRELPGRITHFTPVHRDMDLLCNLARNALLFTAPPCGAGEAACVLGCDFVALGNMGVGYQALEDMVTSRGFAFFTMLEKPVPKTVRKVEAYLGEKCSR